MAGRALLSRAGRRWRDSPRRAAVNLLVSASRPLAVLLAIYVVASAGLPILVLEAMGRVVGDVPGAAAHGLGSSAGHHLIAALILAVTAYAGSLVLGSAQGALSSAIKARLTFAMQDRLVAAVIAPVGVAHLEDPSVLDDLEPPASSAPPARPSREPGTGQERRPRPLV